MYYYDMTTHYLPMNGKEALSLIVNKVKTMVCPSGMKRKKLNLSSLPITLKYGGMQGKIAESTLKVKELDF